MHAGRFITFRPVRLFPPQTYSARPRAIFMLSTLDDDAIFMLDALDDDALLQVLSVLSAEDLASFVRVSRATKVIGRRDVLWARHLKEICAECVTEEFLEDCDHAVGIFDGRTRPDTPEYDGPPLRMPYLNPWTVAEARKRKDAHRAMRLDAYLGAHHANWDHYPREFPRWRVADGVSQYRCYPSSEAKTCPLMRTDVWVPHPFPEARCCGMKLLSLKCFNEYSRSWHGRPCSSYEILDEPVDPRFFDPDAFNALPRHGAFAQMRCAAQPTLSSTPDVHVHVHPEHSRCRCRLDAQALCSVLRGRAREAPGRGQLDQRGPREHGGPGQDGARQCAGGAGPLR